MTGQRRSGGWRSETVMAAMVTGAAAVVVAIVGLFGGFNGFGGGSDEGKTTPTASPEPSISISETTFAVGSAGLVTIRVTGSTSAFRSGDRLYAIARPPKVKRWWVSDPVAPLIGGGWVALIEASPQQGEQLTVSAVRIPAEKFQGAAPPTATGPGGTPTTPTVGATTASPAPSRTSGVERIEQELRTSGEQARFVEVFSPPVTVTAPSG